MLCFRRSVLVIREGRMKLKYNVHIDLQRCAVAADGNETSTAENMSIRTWYRDDTDYGIGFRKLLNCTSTVRILLGNHLQACLSE